VTVALALTGAGLLIGFGLLVHLRAPDGTAGAADVSVIIPARNEAGSLPHLLDSLSRQTLAVREVMVVDDGSTDQTAAVAAAAGAVVVAAPPLPAGWVGKSWACHIGSRYARGEILVFCDADVVVAPDGLERIVASWQRQAPDGLLSVQPFHTTRKGYEQLSAYPNLVAMMASGAFAVARARWSPVAFGPCLVTSKAAYRTVGGHEGVADEIIEDIHLGRAYGAAGRQVQTLAGGSAIAFRMYPDGLRQLVDGWTKNLAGGPRLVSAVPLVASVAWVVASAIVASDAARALLAAAATGEVRAAASAMWALASVQVAVLLRRIGRFAWWAAPAFPLLLAGFVALFLRSVILRTVRRSVTWHDRAVAVRVR
jgi:4,4'-diaponeurosporenoate glycosyltransferase